MTDAYEYGKALFLITEEDGCTEEALSEVNSVRSILKSNPEYVKILDTPALSKEERLSLIDKAFSCVAESVRNLLKILCERRSVYVFEKVADEFGKLYDASRGIERVEAVTAIPLTEEQKDALTKKLSSHLGKTVIISNITDISILGGVKLRYCGMQLDGSVKTRLDKFEEALRSTVI